MFNYNRFLTDMINNNINYMESTGYDISNDINMMLTAQERLNYLIESPYELDIEEQAEFNCICEYVADLYDEYITEAKSKTQRSKEVESNWKKSNDYDSKTGTIKDPDTGQRRKVHIYDDKKIPEGKQRKLQKDHELFLKRNGYDKKSGTIIDKKTGKRVKYIDKKTKDDVNFGLAFSQIHTSANGLGPLAHTGTKDGDIYYPKSLFKNVRNQRYIDPISDHEYHHTSANSKNAKSKFIKNDLIIDKELNKVNDFSLSTLQTYNINDDNDIHNASHTQKKAIGRIYNNMAEMQNRQAKGNKEIQEKRRKNDEYIKSNSKYSKIHNDPESEIGADAHAYSKSGNKIFHSIRKLDNIDRQRMVTNLNKCKHADDKTIHKILSNLFNDPNFYERKKMKRKNKDGTIEEVPMDINYFKKKGYQDIIREVINRQKSELNTRRDAMKDPNIDKSIYK